MTQAAHKPTPAARTAAHSDKAAGHGRRTQVRDSGIHGKGVYAVRPIQAGERVLEYKGEIITWEEALERHPHDPEQPNHTFYFHLDDGHVIDARMTPKLKKEYACWCGAPTCRGTMLAPKERKRRSGRR